MVATADRVGAAKDAGFTGTDAWIASHTQTSRSTAAREVGLAAELGAGHDATAEALDAGLLSPAHAEVILAASRQLPSGVSDAQRQVVEAGLVEKAQRFAPDQLRRIARRAIEAVEPDQTAVDAHENQLVAAEEEAAAGQVLADLPRQRRRHRHRPLHRPHPRRRRAAQGHRLADRPAPDAGYRAPHCRRGRQPAPGDGATGGPASRAAVESPDRSFDWRHRRGLAFAELLEHLPTDHLHPKTAATVVVTIDHTVLDGAMKAAHLDTGETLSAGEARRLACGAGLLPAVLGTGSVALDLGRETRLFTEAQRIAVGLTHDTCAADRLHPPVRLVRAPPPTTLVSRRPHRPRQRGPAVPLAPPTHPRLGLHPPTSARRVPSLHQAHLTGRTCSLLSRLCPITVEPERGGFRICRPAGVVLTSR